MLEILILSLNFLKTKISGHRYIFEKKTFSDKLKFKEGSNCPPSPYNEATEQDHFAYKLLLQALMPDFNTLNLALAENTQKSLENCLNLSKRWINLGVANVHSENRKVGLASYISLLNEEKKI